MCVFQGCLSRDAAYLRRARVATRSVIANSLHPHHSSPNQSTLVPVMDLAASLSILLISIVAICLANALGNVAISIIQTPLQEETLYDETRARRSIRLQAKRAIQ